MRQRRHPTRRPVAAADLFQPKQSQLNQGENASGPPRGERVLSTGRPIILPWHLRNRATGQPLIVDTCLHRRHRRRTPPKLSLIRERGTRPLVRTRPHLTVRVTTQHKHRHLRRTRLRLPNPVSQHPKRVPHRFAVNVRPNTVSLHTRCRSPERPGRVSPVGSMMPAARRSEQRFQ